MASATADMVPAWLPSPANHRAIAGVCEILGGIGILVPGLRRVAGFGLAALLVFVFPANVHAVLMGRVEGFALSPAVLWIPRLPSPANHRAIAGVCEILGGIGILVPGLRRED